MRSCVDDEVMMAFADGELSSQERKNVQDHIQNCPTCGNRWRALLEENKRFADWVKEPELPDGFVEQIMGNVAREDRKSSSEGRNLPKPVFRWISLASAFALLLFGGILWMSPPGTLSPGGDLSTVGVHKKIKRDKNIGQSGWSVTDKGITFRIIKLVARPTEIVATYEILKDGKRIDPRDFARAFLVDAKGKILVSQTAGQRGNYGYVSFRDLPARLPEPLFLEVNSTGINGTPGNWSLRIPVYVSKADQGDTGTGQEEHSEGN